MGKAVGCASPAKDPTAQHGGTGRMQLGAANANSPKAPASLRTSPTRAARRCRSVAGKAEEAAAAAAARPWLPRASLTRSGHKLPSCASRPNMADEPSRQSSRKSATNSRRSRPGEEPGRTHGGAAGRRRRRARPAPGAHQGTHRHPRGRGGPGRQAGTAGPKVLGKE